MTEGAEAPRGLASPLLALPGAVAAPEGPDSLAAWHYGDPFGEQRALEDGSAFVDLSARVGVIGMRGPDRLALLHALTTQDIDHLAPGQSTELLVLDPQGHIEHAAGVVDDGETAWLYTSAGRASALAAWLNAMKFRMAVEVTDHSGEFAVVGEPTREPGGAALPLPAWVDPWPTTAAGGTRYGTPDAEHPGANRPWRLSAVPRGDFLAWARERIAEGVRPAGTWAVDALRIAAWRPDIDREVDHRTLPHELDWLRTAVHLHKGCYRGQEGIARVHNLGRPPRRLVQLHLDGSQNVLPAPGDEVVADGRAVGHVTSVAQHYESGPIALAVVRRSTAADATLVVESADGQVAASQEIVVPVSGESVDRPGPRAEVNRQLGRHGSLVAGPGQG